MIKFLVDSISDTTDYAQIQLVLNDIFNAKELMYAMVRLCLRPSKSGVLKEHSNETD